MKTGGAKPSPNANIKRQFYFSVRADIGKAISNENPNFVAGGDGGNGSARPRLASRGVADLVSAPIATFVTTGGSQVLRRSSLALPVLIAPIG
jgi:hypothetical protein